jgi:hypothetical protein
MYLKANATTAELKADKMNCVGEIKRALGITAPSDNRKGPNRLRCISLPALTAVREHTKSRGLWIE